MTTVYNSIMKEYIYFDRIKRLEISLKLIVNIETTNVVNSINIVKFACSVSSVNFVFFMNSTSPTCTDCTFTRYRQGTCFSWKVESNQFNIKRLHKQKNDLQTFRTRCEHVVSSIDLHKQTLSVLFSLSIRYILRLTYATSVYDLFSIYSSFMYEDYRIKQTSITTSYDFFSRFCLFSRIWSSYIRESRNIRL